MVAATLGWQAGAGTMTDVRTLPVQLRAQANDYWCWAASGEMAMSYVGQQQVLQCEIARVHFSVMGSCCGAANVPATCLQGGWLDPGDFQSFGFTDQEKTVLTWTAIKNEIAHNRPVIDWSKEGHIMVIAGHGRGKTGGQKVLIKDPSPPSPNPTQGGDVYWMNYTTYKKKAYKTYYDIRKTTGNP